MTDCDAIYHNDESQNPRWQQRRHFDKLKNLNIFATD